MGDRDDRESEERRESEKPRQGAEPRRTYHEEEVTYDYTGPITRLVGVAGISAAVVFGGFYLERIGLGEEFSTVATIALVFSLGYWADRRPDKMKRRAGPFWRIAEAIRESREDIRAYTYARPLRVAVTLSVVYGIAIVLLKTALLALLSSLYDWYLAAMLGAAIGALVVAPKFFRDIWSRLAEGPSDYADYQPEDDEEEEDEGYGEEEEYDHEHGEPRERREDED